MQHLVIVDGHHLMYRAYYAIPHTLVTSKGELMNAVYGVASMLISLMRAEEPDALLFCFDAGEQTFRHQENATYKEGRAKTPDDFYLQIPRILEMLARFPVPSVSDLHYEADDFLCTYAKAGYDQGMRVTIITGDRDALQLANERVRIAIPHKGYQAPEYLGPQEILAKYGVRPDQIPSYKGLTGDASDNLPGVQGIGPKTAASLLQKYETLTGVYEHLSEIKESVRMKLEKDREQAFFCERMATLVCTIDLPLPLDALKVQQVQTEQILTFFREVEFTTLVRRLESLSTSDYGKTRFEQVEIKKAPEKKQQKNVPVESQMSMF